MVGHRQIVTPTRVLVYVPRCVRLPQMNARLSDHDAIEVVILSFESLGQDIPAERTEHRKQMRLGYILNLVRPEDSDRQNIKGIEDFFGSIGAEIADNLVACPLFPVHLVSVAILIPFLKFLNGHYGAPPLCRRKTQAALSYQYTNWH